MEGVPSIFYYKNYLHGENAPSMTLAVLLPPRPMRSIRLVIALLYPRDELQHAFNRIYPQG
jgi:hypothetical protein